LPQEATKQRRTRKSAGLGGDKDPMNEEQKNGTRSGTRRVFDDTFKQNAVQITLKGDRSMRQVAEQLGITESLLHTWRRRFAPTPAGASLVKGAMTPEEKDNEIILLRAENVRLREREIVLKKSLGILSETPERGMPRLRR
jgi:transposase